MRQDKKERNKIITWRVVVACLAYGLVAAFCRRYWDWAIGHASGPYRLLDLTTSLVLAKFARYEPALYMSLLGLSLGFVVCFSRTKGKALMIAVAITVFVFFVVDFPSVFIAVGMTLGEQAMAATLRLLGWKIVIWLVLPMILSCGFVVLFYDIVRTKQLWVFIRNTGLFAVLYLTITLLSKFFLFDWDLSRDGNWESYFSIMIVVSAAIFISGITGQFIIRAKRATENNRPE